MISHSPLATPVLDCHQIIDYSFFIATGDVHMPTLLIDGESIGEREGMPALSSVE